MTTADRTPIHDRVLAVDLGGTNLRVAVVDRDGNLTHRQHAPTRADEGPGSVLERMASLISSVARVAGLPAGAPVGIASPGPINPRTGVVYFTPNLPDWRDVELTGTITRLTGRPAFAGNDANCAGLGEVAFGAARGSEDVVYLGLGTGVGGAVISGGRLVDGVRGLGAELGHVCVAIDGPRCTCGAIGCLEAFVSGWAIAREASLVVGTADGDAIRRHANGDKPNASVVAAAAIEGDPAAIEILRRAGRALGAAMGAFANIFNPQLFVVGGGVATVGDLLLGPARETLPGYSFAAMRQDLSIVPASLEDDAGLYGAASLALTSS